MCLLELVRVYVAHLAAYRNVADTRLFDPGRLKEGIRVKSNLIIKEYDVLSGQPLFYFFFRNTEGLTFAHLEFYGKLLSFL